jgi:transposase
MLIKTILNKTHRFKSFIYTHCDFINDSEVPRIEVKIEPRKNSKGICSACGKKGSCYDHLETRRFEFIPIWGIKIYFIYKPRRINCKKDGPTVEVIPWADGKHQLTNTFRVFLANWGKKLSWKSTAESFNVSWEHVFRSIKYVVGYGLANRNLNGITAIGVDEIKYKKGHKYLTLVYQIDEGTRRLLYVGKDRTTKTLLRFFHEFGKARSKKLQFICTDMWKPYLKIIKKKAGHALNILDRFHIKKYINEAVDNTRKEEAAKMAKEGYEPILKKSRWALLKNPKNRTSNQTLKIRELLQYNLQSVKGYLLKLEFERFWKYRSPYWAEVFLNEWTEKVMRSRIEPMKKVAKMLRRHQPLMLNWFKVKGVRLSSGPVEGMNNKAKVAMRKAYGFKEYEVLKLALYHQLGDLPEPELTHRFC